MNPYRCQLCGETYLGPAEPERCPFCGAAYRHLVAAAEWINYGRQDMCEQSAKDVGRAIELELNNAAFYTCARHKAQNQISEAIFARVAKQEAEHAQLLAKMLGIEYGASPAVECSEQDEEKFAEAHRRERRASNFYLEAAGRAPESRVRDVLHALSEIETEHLKLSNTFR